MKYKEPNFGGNKFDRQEKVIQAKRKELKNLAKKIAKQEKILQVTTDQSERKKAEDEIVRLSGQVDSLEDIALIDEMIQEILSQT